MPNHLTCVHMALLLVALGSLRAPRRSPRFSPFSLWLLKLLGLMAVTLILGLLGAEDLFALIHDLTIAIFIYTPLISMGHIWQQHRHHPRLCGFIAAVTGLVLLIGTYAFFIEPQWLEVTEHTLISNKLNQSVRVAVIADLQTDRPGAFDETVFEQVNAAQPDLIVFMGDYVQESGDAYYQAVRSLNVLLQAANFQPSLGMVAIQGNIDHGDWQSVFIHTGTRIIDQTETLDLGPLAITGLCLEDSFQLSQPIAEQDKFHLVLGHCPNFALGQVDADLLLAGHTHGGQIQVPGFGPLLTFSRVPRHWAGGGLHQIEPGKHLCVSRGLGMERHTAPRLRFLCRPELVIFDLTPSSQHVNSLPH